MATAAVKKILLQIELQGRDVLNALKKGFAESNAEMAKTNKMLSSLGTAMKAALGIAAVRTVVASVTQMADSYQMAVDRISIFVGSTEKASEVMAQITDVANANRTTIENVATTYNRLSMAMSDVGLSSEQTLAVTDMLVKTFRLSGSTSSEATAAVIQLAQGLASGQLRGQEMRSVLEQNALMGEILAKTFGKTRGELMKLAETGFFTSDKVLNALAANQDRVNQMASKLNLTFGQMTDIIKNDLTASLGKMVSEMQLPDKLLKGYEILRDNIIGISVALGTVTAVLARGTIIATLGKVGTAVATIAKFALSLKGALVIAGVAMTVFAAEVIRNWERTKIQVAKIWEYMSLGVKLLAKDMVDAFAVIPLVGKYAGDAAKNLSSGIDDSRKKIEEYNKALEGMKEAAKSPTRVQQIAAMDTGALPSLAELNKMLKEGMITLDKYDEYLQKIDMEKLSKSFNDGKINIYKFNEELRKTNVEELNRQVIAGEQSWNMLNNTMKANALEEVNEKLRQGTISAQEYVAQMNKLNDSFGIKGGITQGLNDYMDSVQSVSQGIAGAVEKTFKGLEDGIINFAKTGKLSFKDMAYEMIEDLSRVIMRAMVLKPLANGILNAMGGGPSDMVAMNWTGGSEALAANGYAPAGTGVSMFAKGGIVNGATPFTYGGSKLGIMGEAGPEAIMPLTRGADGKLGVQTTGTPAPVIVNIVNNSGAEIQETSSVGPNGEQMLDILITNKVREGFAKGSFDTALGTNYGIKRRGR